MTNAKFYCVFLLLLIGCGLSWARTRVSRRVLLGLYLCALAFAAVVGWAW